MRVLPRSRRRAFSLMEIILVVVIILIVTAIAVPVIRSMVDDSRATAAGDMVRGRMADARSRAMEDGRPWRVAVIPGTGVIQIAPEESQEWEQMAQNTVETLELYRDQLPPEIIFGTSMEEVLSASGKGTPGNAWETLAVYLPAGDAREDHVAYFGKTGFYPRSVVLRGLTGAVTIEEPNAKVLP